MALAAMSIDLGSQYIKIGLVKPGVPMEIVLNKESQRKTPFLVAIRNGERFFSDAAVAIVYFNITKKSGVVPRIVIYTILEKRHKI